MSGDPSLFGDDQSSAPVQTAHVETPIPDWLVNQLKDALTSLGLTTMAERQLAIEAAAERPVQSLRALTRAEALRVLERLSFRSAPPAPSASAWDAREEDTWIDRL